ncbi:APC family permease [Stygiolobus caldivivus]|uniref:Amino acid permease n=1 Tax=Stygiolobus caldivivus TaxID=2824673 RepID=A0A8D5U774_9CREN|nr:APC family permease [Stygiolobus caldivivus]BCU70841.1 amino acid permease [Stygiolobus caldivivus]
MSSQGKSEVTKNKSGLSFLDLFFISFGGQAPYISLLTFGTAMIAEVGLAGSFAMLVATVVVLFNGLVVYFLSKRYKRGGGYYVYALYSLTPRLGLNTGWTYLMYALSYGGTLLAGGAYVLYTILSEVAGNSGLMSVFQQWVIALVICVIASSLVLAGVKVSARYAMVMSIIEMVAIGALGVYFLYESGWRFYNPVPSSLSPNILDAVVLGLGIPTGYGSIAPLGEEAKSRDIGKAAIAVLLFGGLLATFFFYSLGALGFTGNLVEYLLTNFGFLVAIMLAFIALNDGTLGGMTYMLANSRTLKAMADDRVFPGILARKKNNKPLYSEIAIATLFTSVIVFLSYSLGLYNTFLILGSLAGMFNLFIHLSADFSLIRVSSKRFSKHKLEIGVGVIAVLISLFVMLYSIPGFQDYVVYAFMGWIILGFLYAEAREMVIETSEEDNK